MKTSLLILIALLLIGGGTYVYIQEKQATQTLTQTTSTAQSLNSQTATTTDASPILEPIVYPTDYHYMPGAELVFIPSSASKDRIVIPPNIATKIMGSGQSLTDESAVVNPINPNQIILSTNEGDVQSPIKYVNSTVTDPSWAGYFPFINRIYSYDLGTKELTLLSTSEDKSNPVLELIVIGTQSSRIILGAHRQGVDTCGGLLWLESADRYTYLDMNNIDAGLRPYVIPADKIEQEKSNEVGCPGN